MSWSVSAVLLLVPDYEAGIAFYVGKLGFTLVEDTPLDDGKRWVLVSTDDGTQTRLLLAKAADSAQQAAIGNQAGGRVFLCLKTDDFDADHERFTAAGGGSIINLGSNSWWEAQGGFPAYTTAKSAVHGLTRTMARDLGEHRIRVNTVVPGWIMTERQKELWATPEALEKHLQRQCLPDLIEPVYVARMVVFLASDDAGACTANNFFVEAGST